MIHIDAHCDTSGPYEGSKFHHGGPFRQAVLDGVLDPDAHHPDRHPRRRGISLGVLLRQRHDRDPRRGIRRDGAGGRRWRRRARSSATARPMCRSTSTASIPAFAPGTGTPEVGGLDAARGAARPARPRGARHRRRRRRRGRAAIRRDEQYRPCRARRCCSRSCSLIDIAHADRALDLGRPSPICRLSTFSPNRERQMTPLLFTPLQLGPSRSPTASPSRRCASTRPMTARATRLAPPALDEPGHVRRGAGRGRGHGGGAPRPHQPRRTRPLFGRQRARRGARSAPPRPWPYPARSSACNSRMPAARPRPAPVGRRRPAEGRPGSLADHRALGRSPMGEDWHMPRRWTKHDFARVKQAFVDAAPPRRARRLRR